MSDAASIQKNKKTDSVYISKPITNKHWVNNENGELEEKNRNIRIISKVSDHEEEYTFTQIKDELVIRKTSGGRQEVIAKVFEDSKGIFVLSFQRYTSASGKPHEASFSFVGEEIYKVSEFINNIPKLPLNSSTSTSIKDSEMANLKKSTTIDTEEFITKNEDLILEILKHKVTTEDIVTFGYRKKQLETFEKLLSDENFFLEKKTTHSVKREEDLWQKFFERNPWIFGYGLDFVFNAPLDDKKMEKVVSGFDFNNGGKRADALLKTKGLIDSLCFVEIKTHKSHLLKQLKNPIRPECWQVSDTITEGVSQVQKTIQKSIKELSTKIEIKNAKTGGLTGEKVFLYSPKSYLIVGSLSEFCEDNGINEDKYSSFELFRQGLKNIEIITFDELYERAKFIIQNAEMK